jgi:hypothetical protein
VGTGFQVGINVLAFVVVEVIVIIIVDWVVSSFMVIATQTGRPRDCLCLIANEAIPAMTRRLKIDRG